MVGMGTAGPLRQELPPRGTGLLLGTARRGLERGRGVPLTTEERRRRHEAIFGQGVLRGLLGDYIEWLMARPKIREYVPKPSASRATRPAIY